MKSTRYPGIYSYETRAGVRYACWASTGSGKQRSRKGLRSLDQARAVKAELENAGTAPARMTVAQFLSERWLPSIVGRPNTRRTARVHANYISRAIGDVKLQRLEPYHAEQLKSWLERSGLSANTKHSCFGIFRRALRHALRQNLISRNPASPDYVDSPRRQRRHPDIATLPTAAMIEAVQALLRVADSTRYGLIVRTAIMSGLRESEIFGLEWRHVDFATGWLHVTRESTKTDAGERSVFVDVDLLERLRAHRADQIRRHREPIPTHVFTSQRGRPWTQAGFWKHWDNIRRAADLPGLHFHDLRHLQGTLLQRANVHMSVAARRLGHVDATMTSLYTHSNRAEQEAAVEAVASLFHRKEGGR